MKYPRTWHCPWSLGKSSDDKVLVSTDHFIGKEVIISEKLDGESCGMDRKICHARSLDSKNHPSRNYVKGIWGRIRHEIPEGWKLFGENMFAKHSIHYNALTDYFYLIGIVDNRQRFLSWEETVEWATILDLKTVPLIWDGIYDEALIQSLWPRPSFFGAQESEGYVIRTTEEFAAKDFQYHVAKFVRKEHIQTSEFWANEPIIPNLLESKHA